MRYDRTVDFEPFEDGFRLMRDAQTAKPQSFRTGDGWFTFNLATNLAQMVEDTDAAGIQGNRNKTTGNNERTPPAVTFR